MSWTRLPSAVLVILAFALTGCVDDASLPLDSDAAAEAPTLSASSVAGLPEAEFGGRHLVVFESRRGIPRDFETMVGDLGATVEAAYGQVGAAMVSGLDVPGAAALSDRADVMHVEMEPVLELKLPELSASRVQATAEPASPADPSGAFFYPDQWNMRAIHAPAAWAAGRLGSASVRVAILDTGIDYRHGDLQGLVDMSRSASFLPQDDALVDLYFPGLDHITDLVWHGTHVASNVAANGWGMAGITSQVTLMGVKVCSVYGSCPGGAIFQGILFAVDNDADVVNMSLGGAFLKKANPGFVAILNRLFNYARTRGVTVVVASGNSAWDLDRNRNWFSTYCDARHVICVSATGPTAWTPPYDWENVDAPALYSNHGRSAISVAAPGGNDGDFVVGACTQTSLVLPPFFGCSLSPWYYLWAAGTSMAAPHVAGVAGLLVEDHGRAPHRIKTVIQQTADDLGQPGTDPWYGKGRLNMATAVGAE